MSHTLILHHSMMPKAANIELTFVPTSTNSAVKFSISNVSTTQSVPKKPKTTPSLPVVNTIVAAVPNIQSCISSVPNVTSYIPPTSYIVHALPYIRTSGNTPFPPPAWVVTLVRLTLNLKVL